MVKKLLLLLLCLGLFFPSEATAQNALKLSVVEVDLWPEYDRPTMLVIYRITLASNVVLPAPIKLRIPASVGSLNAVANQQPDGSLMNVPYELEGSGDWVELVFQTTTPEIQVEYYDPSLIKDGANRQFEYHWPGDYAVDNFVIQVQQPTGATDMQISPSIGSPASAGDGFVYYNSEIGALALGQDFSIHIQYQKQTDDLSASDMPISPSGPLDDNTLRGINFADALPWLLGFVGLVLLVGGGLWYWQSGKEPVQSEHSRRRNRKKPVSQEGLNAVDGDFIYCHQCGKRAGPGDRFCRACGTPLRIS